MMGKDQDRGYGYPYPAQGGYPPQPPQGYPPQGYPPQQQQFYQQGPVMPPPQYNQPTPNRKGFLEGCLAALCCCCLLDECCCDPTIFIN
ncbi:unnamed protein product [Calypogeia fissa]